MLERPSKPTRAARRRERQRAGIEYDLRVRIPTRRLASALRLAAGAENRDLPARPSRTELEDELHTMLEALITRWLGPPR
jgi:hypothetical protein